MQPLNDVLAAQLCTSLSILAGAVVIARLRHITLAEALAVIGKQTAEKVVTQK